MGRGGGPIEKDSQFFHENQENWFDAPIAFFLNVGHSLKSLVGGYQGRKLQG